MLTELPIKVENYAVLHITGVRKLPDRKLLRGVFRGNLQGHAQSSIDLSRSST